MWTNNNTIATPFFLYDKNILKKNSLKYSSRKFYLNYSIKSCSFLGVLQEIEALVDGFTVTSISDLNKIRKLSKKPIHYVSPLIRREEIETINIKGNTISFNSIESFERLRGILNDSIKVFIRINPNLSFLDDNRYDPCRPYSKLGASLKNFISYLDANQTVTNIYGIHFHTNCQSVNPDELEKTLLHIEKHLGEYLHLFKEINIGGGYLYSDNLLEKVNMIQKDWNHKYGLSLRMEPSFDIVNSAGFLYSTIVDIFQTSGKIISILDTAINHLPETFEYGNRPEILEPLIMQNGPCSYILAGSTCLAGDIFGEYFFQKPLKIGDIIIFKNVGAYSLVRANTFNGVPVPNAYIDIVKNITNMMKGEPF